MALRRWDYGRWIAQQADFAYRWCWGKSKKVRGKNDNVVYAVGSGLLNGGGTNGISLALAGSTGIDGFAILSIALQTIRAQLGFSPILVRAAIKFQKGTTYDSPAVTLHAYRCFAAVDVTDCNNRYRDSTGSLEWGGVGWEPYWPIPGTDIGATEMASAALPAISGSALSGYVYEISILPEILDKLRSGGDALVYFDITGAETNYIGLSMDPDHHAYLDFAWMFEVEPFQALPDGTIDLASSVDGGTAGDSLYLGALERSSIGSAVKTFWRNNTTLAIPHIEIIDDHPESSIPLKTVDGGGTAAGLDYVAPISSAVSQLYTVRVLAGGATFEVKAVAYRDVSTSYHSTFDADADLAGYRRRRLDLAGRRPPHPGRSLAGVGARGRRRVRDRRAGQHDRHLLADGQRGPGRARQRRRHRRRA